jgi:hypothetical protein
LTQTAESDNTFKYSGCQEKREEILENRDNHVSITDQGKGYSTKRTRRLPIRNADFFMGRELNSKELSFNKCNYIKDSLVHIQQNIKGSDDEIDNLNSNSNSDGFLLLKR